MEFRVVIAEDSAVVRERLVILLSSIQGLSVIGAMNTSPEATSAIRCLNPDAVVLGTHAVNPSVLSLLLAIKKDRPDLFVIALGNAPCTVCRKCYLAAGADLYLDKTCEFDRIGPALLQASVRSCRVT